MSTLAPTPPPAVTEFDPLAFWIQHKSKIQLLAALLVVGLLAYGVFEFAQMRSRESAARAFAEAKTPEDLRKVLADHPRSVVAANAQLILAEQLRTDGKADESIAILRDFIEKRAEHPLIAGAYTSLAVSLEAQGKTDDALATYQKVLAVYPASFAAPVALLAQGRLHLFKGETDQARRAYEQVLSQFGEGNFAREALMELQKIKKPAAPEAAKTEPASAAPAPVVAYPATDLPPVVPAPAK